MVETPIKLPTPDLSAEISKLEVFIFRVPLKTPRVNSFGSMTHRTALIVRLIDAEGAEGWGECFCNWPAFAAEHRYRILTEILAPKLEGKKFTSPGELTSYLNAKVRILRIQADEPGPFDQAIAAVDIAAWDLAARKEDKPLYQVLGGAHSLQSVPYYASGLTPEHAVEITKRELETGTYAFKTKVGFNREKDLYSLTALREVIGPDRSLMVDVNQKWNMATAKDAILSLEPFYLEWVEEPVPADHSADDFAILAELGIPIAAGENVRGSANFQDMIVNGKLSVVQPDIIKWGGISGCFPIAKRALNLGVRYCPHYLGGGIGLLATAHLLAAIGGDGMLELDATPNELRTLLADPFPVLADGKFSLPQSPGLGVVPDLAKLAEYQQHM